MRHGEATHRVTFTDGETFRLCHACASDAVGHGATLVERVAT